MERRPLRLTSENELAERVVAMREQSSRMEEAEKVKQSLQDRVSMLHLFDPFDVEGDLGPAEVTRILGADVEPATDDEGKARWSLRPGVRDASLARLGTAKEILASARKSRARIATHTQLLFESWLEGKPPPIPTDEEGIAELRMVACWMENVRGAHPPAASVLASVQRERFRARLGAAVGPSFRGRAAELEELRHEALGPRTIVIEARGGMGKSALLAKLLLDLGAFEPNTRVLAAHLDLDDSNLDVAEPTSLLEAIAVQLDAQVDQSLREFKQQAQAARRGTMEANDGPSRDMFLAMQLRKRFEGWMQSSSSLGQPYQRVVIIVDTIDRGFAKSPELTRAAIDVLLTSLTGIPSTLILSGRAPIPKHLFLEDETRLTLDELDEDAAVGVLLSLGVPTESFARALADKFGRLPLTLRLVARVVTQEQGGFSEKDLTSPELDDAVEHALVLGFLYRRILAHALDPRVRRIAHPGFALRAITPALVENVLGWAPDPPVRDSADAKQLHEKLRGMHDLVVVDADGETVRLRPEVRTEALRLMRKDPTAANDLARVHEAAIAWFGRSGANEAAKAEEVYHLLHLGRFDDAASRWTPEIARRLTDAGDDLDENARAWLEERLDDDAFHAHAEREKLRAWEDDAAKRIDMLLARGSAEEAETILQERDARTMDNARFALAEAKIHAAQARSERAREAAQRAVSLAEGASDHRSAAEAHTVLAQIARVDFVEGGWGRRRDGTEIEEGSIWVESLTRWQAARAHARNVENALFRTRILALATTELLRADVTKERMLAKGHAVDDVPNVEALEPLRDLPKELSEVFLRTPISDLERMPALVRSIASLFENVDVLRRALTTNALRYAMSLELEPLASALEDLGDAAKPARDALMGFSSDDGQGWGSILHGAAKSDALGRVLDFILERHPHDVAVHQAIAGLFGESRRIGGHVTSISVRDRSLALARLTRIVAEDVAPDDWLAVLAQIAPTQVTAVKTLMERSEHRKHVGVDAAEASVLFFQKTGGLAAAVRELKAITPPARSVELGELAKAFAP
jgi:cellulose synthase operon protein C